MSGARDHIQFFLNGERCTASGADALLTVSDYLRRRRHLTGTKIVCSEGDCGSCTVLVGRATSQSSDAPFRYLPIDSCIQFLFQLDGAHLVTIEGLAVAGELTAVQQAMVDCHGSQCGFCTPGFVMAMTGAGEAAEGANPCEQTWRKSLTGNLCRCTGYSQIIEAGQQACEADWQHLEEQYPSPPLRELALQAWKHTIQIKAPDAEGHRQLLSPVTLAEALAFRAAHPEAYIVAGATDLGVLRNKGRIEPHVYLDLNRLESLASVAIETNNAGRTLIAGARATWTDLLSVCRRELPEFAKILEVFGSPQIRHAATIGGNLINASPIADSLPLLYVMHARLQLDSEKGARSVDVNDFYHDYKQFDLQPDELLTKIELPLPTEEDLLRLYKVSRRRDLDISTFTAAIRLQLQGDTIAEAHLAYGAVGPTILRLPKTEARLVGAPFDEATMRAAGDVAVQEITPLSDVRGAADYRLQLARNVLLKFYAEHQAGLLACGG